MPETQVIQLILTHPEAEILKAFFSVGIVLSGMHGPFDLGVGVDAIQAQRHVKDTPELREAYNALADKMNLLPSILNMPAEIPPTV